MGKNDFPRHFSANSYTQWAALLTYGDLCNECFDEGNMVFMSKYIWFRDNLELFSIWQAILRAKLQFSCHFYRNSWTKWSVWLTYGDIWKECFDEGNMVFMCKYTSFRDNLDLYTIWEAIVNEKNDFSCPFLGEKISGENFFSAKFFLLRMLQFAKKSCFWNFHFSPKSQHLENFSPSVMWHSISWCTIPPPGEGKDITFLLTPRVGLSLKKKSRGSGHH